MKKNYPKVFIIVLNYNGGDLLKECLRSIYQSDYPDYEAVIVDNDSSDGSFELAKNYFSKAHFIKNEKNIGFAGGNNVAIRFALEKFADYILLLNNDATVEKNAISEMVNFAQKDKKVGILGPIVYNQSGNIWFSGGKIKWLTMKSIHISKNIGNEAYETEFISGCAMFVGKEVFQKIGLLDDKYFLYYEDDDFCVRARKKGFRCVVVPRASVTHFEKSEKNPESKTYWLVLSGLIFFEKHMPLIFRPWTSLYLFLRKTKNWFDVRIRRDNISNAVQKAYRDYKNLAK